MKIHTLLCLSLLMVLSSCGVVRVSADYDRSTDFNNFSTYSFHQKGLEKLKMNDLDKKRVIKAIENEMALRGYTRVADDGELVVNVLASSKQKIDVNQNNWGWGWGWGPWWGWGGPNMASVREYTAGTLLIDIVDNKKNILIWQGAGRDLNVSDLDRKAERIPKAISQIMSKFPVEIKKSRT